MPKKDIIIVLLQLETALTKRGAKFHKTDPCVAFVIDDGNLVTEQNPASAKGPAQNST